MAINKDYIVDTLMGGFGIKGTVPIAISRPGYINSSAAPPSFDLEGAKALLDSAGIVAQPGSSGFRVMPDGTQIRATILTPPKDYDPVRADSGIMISNNLKKIGLNIDAAPTSFDTIVSRAFSPPVDFDIYILGFLITVYPENYLRNFFHSSSDVNINSAGQNSAGYNNKQVDELIDRALVTLDTSTRVKIIKDIEGIVTNDIPWNILYYRKNLNAYRNDAWVGWVNTPPQIYNFWSVTKLSPAGTV
jgi:peptide/nickel transport system substrate-binding protein